MIRVFDTSEERTKNLSADDSIIFSTINCDGIERFWCMSGMEELKAWWWKEDYDGPADDDEVTEFFVAGERVWGITKFYDVVTTYGFTEKPESFVMKFTLYEDLTGIRDSMQINSETVIACLEGEHRNVEVSVRGEVKVYFDERMNGEPDCYRYPSEFPRALKDIISGKEPIVCAEGIEPDGRWELDERVEVEDNNWFEMFVYDKKTNAVISSDVVDVEGYTSEQLLELMKKADVADGRESETVQDTPNRKVYVYHTFNDGLAYGEQEIRVFDLKDNAIAYMHKEACNHFGAVDFYEIPKVLGLKETDDYMLERDYVCIEEREGYRFFVVEEKEVE